MITQLLTGSAGGIAVFAVTLWLVASRDDNPYKEIGHVRTLLRCVLMVVGFHALDVLILNGAEALGGDGMMYVGLGVVTIAWFVGIILLFRRTLVQAIILTVAMIFVRAIFVFVSEFLG